MTGVEKDEGILVRALTALAEHGMPTDVQELLLRGEPMRGIAPGALNKALAEALGALMAEKERLEGVIARNQMSAGRHELMQHKALNVLGDPTRGVMLGDTSTQEPDHG